RGAPQSELACAASGRLCDCRYLLLARASDQALHDFDSVRFVWVLQSPCGAGPLVCWRQGKLGNECGGLAHQHCVRTKGEPTPASFVELAHLSPGLHHVPLNYEHLSLVFRGLDPIGDLSRFGSDGEGRNLADPDWRDSIERLDLVDDAIIAEG